MQIAYYEALGLDGLRAYKDTVEYLRAQGLPVIADVKRGDIAKRPKCMPVHTLQANWKWIDDAGALYGAGFH